MVKDHKRTRRPQHGEHWGDCQQDGRGLSSWVPSKTEAATAAAELAYDDGIEREENRAGEQINGGTVDPYQYVLSCAAAAAAVARSRHPVPQLRPPVIRDAGDQAANVHCQDHFASSGWVGYGVVAQRMANGDVAIHGQGHCDPDGGVDGGELQNLHGFVERVGQRRSENEVLQKEVHKYDQQQDQDVGYSQGQ